MGCFPGVLLMNVDQVFTAEESGVFLAYEGDTGCTLILIQWMRKLYGRDIGVFLLQNMRQ